MSQICGRRHGYDIVYCELPAGHDKAEARTRKRNSGLKARSDKQERRTDFLMGIKAERLAWQLSTAGYMWCESCKQPFYPESAVVEAATQQAMSAFDSHHVTPRDKGRGYRSPTDHGLDSPANIQILCRVCHAKTEAEPEFSGGGDRIPGPMR